MPPHSNADPASTDAMRSYWDARAVENAPFFIHSQLDYDQPDLAEFWRSGEDNLRRTLEPFTPRFLATDRVLEIGCGIGRITRAIAGQAAHVVGVDVSEEMVRRARRELADLENVQILQGNGRDLSELASGSFDACYSFIVFQHIPDPDITCEYIVEIGRVLRPGGWAVFQVSDQPEIHRPAYYKRSLRAMVKMRRELRYRHTLEPQWLGSAVPRLKLLAALGRGGLTLEGAVGEGTQFCLLSVRRDPRR
jgi:SAM-dependent methyltransferase